MIPFDYLFLVGAIRYSVPMHRHLSNFIKLLFLSAPFPTTSCVSFELDTQAFLAYCTLPKKRILMSQFQNVPFWPISSLGSKFNPRNTSCIPPVEIIARLDLDQTETF
jgi:hypothetical protein